MHANFWDIISSRCRTICYLSLSLTDWIGSMDRWPFRRFGTLPCIWGFRCCCTLSSSTLCWYLWCEYPSWCECIKTCLFQSVRTLKCTGSHPVKYLGLCLIVNPTFEQVVFPVKPKHLRYNRFLGIWNANVAPSYVRLVPPILLYCSSPFFFFFFFVKWKLTRQLRNWKLLTKLLYKEWNFRCWFFFFAV